jgi:hypothetical protein
MNFEKLKSLMSQIDDVSKLANDLGFRLNIDMDVIGAMSKPKQSTVMAVANKRSVQDTTLNWPNIKNRLNTLTKMPEWTPVERALVGKFVDQATRADLVGVVKLYMELVRDLGAPTHMSGALTLAEGGRLIDHVDPTAYIGVAPGEVLDPVEFVQRRQGNARARKRIAKYMQDIPILLKKVKSEVMEFGAHILRQTDVGSSSISGKGEHFGGNVSVSNNKYGAQMFNRLDPSDKERTNKMSPTSKKIWNIVLANSVDGVISRKMVHDKGKKENLSNVSIGLTLRHIENLGLIQRDNENIKLIRH